MTIAAVITVSDSRSHNQADDLSGPAAAETLARFGLQTDHRLAVPDEIDAIRGAVREAAGRFPLVVTTGGTGVGPRDVTPEALESMFDRSLPGFGEIMRTASFQTTPLSIISRGGAGLIGRCLVVMLPGSPKGVRECLSLVGPAIKHLLKVLEGGPLDCQGESPVT